MKIISDKTPLTYKDLHIGDIFEFNSNYYMVTDGRNSINNRYVAIKLSTGIHYNFNDDEVIKLCEATLHIKKICEGK